MIQHTTVRILTVKRSRQMITLDNLTFNPLTTNVPHHIETSQFICTANQLAGFYMMGNISR